MDRMLQARLAISAIGVGIWGYGYATDNSGVRMTAIVILAISLALRFVAPRPPKDGDTA